MRSPKSARRKRQPRQFHPSIMPPTKMIYLRQPDEVDAIFNRIMHRQKTHAEVWTDGQQQLARLNQAVVLAKPESHQGHLEGLEELYRRAERNHPILRPLHLLYPQFSRKRLADSTFIEPVPKRMCLRVMAREILPLPIEQAPLALAAPLAPQPNQLIPPVNAVGNFYYLSSDSSDDEDEEESVPSDEETLLGESIELPVEEDEVPPAADAPLPNQVFPPVNAVDDSFSLSSDSSDDEDEEESVPSDEETLLGESIELPVEEDEVPPAADAPLAQEPNQEIPPANAVDDSFNLSSDSSNDEDEEEVESVLSDEDSLVGESIELPAEEDDVPPAAAAPLAQPQPQQSNQMNQSDSTTQWDLSAQDKSDTSFVLGAFTLCAFTIAAEKKWISGEDLSKFAGMADADQIEIDDEVNFDLDADADIGMDDASNSSSSISVEEEDRAVEVDREEESTDEMEDREEAAVEECVTEGDVSESGGAADTAQVDETSVNFEADVDAYADTDDPPNSSSSTTHSAVGQDDTGIPDEAAVRRERRLRRVQRKLESNLGDYWKKSKLPRELECHLGDYWTEPSRRRRIIRK